MSIIIEIGRKRKKENTIMKSKIIGEIMFRKREERLEKGIF